MEKILKNKKIWVICAAVILVAVILVVVLNLGTKKKNDSGNDSGNSESNETRNIEKRVFTEDDLISIYNVKELMLLKQLNHFIMVTL